MSAFYVTSFLRCDLFICIDHLLCMKYSPPDLNTPEARRMNEEQQHICLEFLEEFFLFTLSYLRHQNQLTPIYAEWKSLKKPLLYLVSPVLAYLAAANEIMDSFCKMLGREEDKNRNLRFYEAHVFKPNQASANLDLGSMKKTPIPIPIANFVALFIFKKGYELILDLLTVQQ